MACAADILRGRVVFFNNVDHALFDHVLTRAQIKFFTIDLAIDSSSSSADYRYWTFKTVYLLWFKVSVLCIITYLLIPGTSKFYENISLT